MAGDSGSGRRPVQVILVRHGPTSWSVAGRHTGRTDLPLLADSKASGPALRAALGALCGPAGPAVVLTSPLQRARATCELAGLAADAVVDDDLVEWDYGEYEGLTRAEIRERQPGWDVFSDGCPGGEQLAQVAARAGAVIARLQADEALADRPAVLFAHAHLLRVLAAVWAELDPAAGRALPLDTGGIGVLGWAREDRAIERWNWGPLPVS